jgi:hypothetical protein
MNNTENKPESEETLEGENIYKNMDFLLTVFFILISGLFCFYMMVKYVESFHVDNSNTEPQYGFTNKIEKLIDDSQKGREWQIPTTCTLYNFALPDGSQPEPDSYTCHEKGEQLIKSLAKEQQHEYFATLKDCLEYLKTKNPKDIENLTIKECARTGTAFMNGVRNYTKGNGKSATQ